MRRRRRRVSRLELFYGVVIIGLMVGGSLWLDRHGVPVTGRVAAKHERIVVGHEPSGEWRRHYEVTAAFELPEGGSSQATVRVPRVRYDSLRAGDPIALRYLPEFPLLARTTDRSTAGVAGELAWGLAGIPILMWVVGGFLALWIAARMGTVPVLAAGAAWLAAGYSLLLSPTSREGPRPAHAMALVGGVTLVDKSPAHVRSRRRTSRFDRRLEVPYQVVELLVPVRGGRDTVLAVDAVDSGSVAGLAHGSVLPVRLDPAAPREAQLAGGTRRFVEENRYHFLIPVIGCGILGTVAALTYRWRRRKRQATGAPKPRERTMETGMPSLGLVLLMLAVPSPESRLAAQPGAPADGIHACDLLSNADVEKVTGRPSRKPPDRLADVQMTHSFCSFRDARVWIAISTKVSAAQKHVYQELEVGGYDKANHAVAGLGDSAAIYFRPEGKDPRGLLVVHAGSRTLTVGVKMDAGQPSDSALPFAVGLAKVALAKLD